MSNDLTNGRLLPCNDQVGGIVNVYFFNFNAPGIDDISVSSDFLVTSFDTSTAYQWEVKGANLLDNTINSSQANGTNFVESVLTLQLINIDPTDEAEIMKMAVSRPRIVVQDRNGVARLMGYREGCNLTAGNITTGTAEGDFVGANLTFTAREKRFPLRLSGATETNPFAGQTETVTVVSA